MAKNEGFDLGAMLADLVDVPNSGTNREQIEYIPISQLEDDPNNFYELRGLDKLADNISLCGLQQPIRVRQSAADPNRYTIVSGHRRRAALKLLAEGGAEQWAEAPCIVERDAVSPSLQQLRLIYANANTRALTPAELSEQAVQVEKLLYQLKEEGYEFPGRMRDHVAQAVNASKSKLSRLKVIREKLIPMWEPLFKQNKISESVAYSLAQLDPEWQNLMYNHWNTRLNALCQGHADNVKKIVEKVSQIDCRAHTGCKCHIPSDRRKHIAALGQYDSYSCIACCLDCSSLATCKDSCYLASMKKERLIQKCKDEKAERKAAEKEKIAPTLELIQGVYARWYEALKQKGLTTEEYLKLCGRTYWVESSAKEFETYATHPEKVKAENTKLPFPNNFWPGDAACLCKAADALGCSIDWLLGREGYPGPGEMQNAECKMQNGPDLGPGWERFVPAPEAWGNGATEDPLAAGDYVVLAKWSKHDKMKPYILSWDGDKWLYSDVDAAAAGAIICYWMPMPED